MHRGVLVAAIQWSALYAELHRHAGTFRDLGPVAADAALDPDPEDSGDGFLLIGGELNGRAYLIDPSFLLSGMLPDLIADIALAQDAVVAACLAETVSGTFAFVAARGPTLLRHHFNSHTDLTRPYETGRPLPTEHRQPLEDLDGAGLLAALGSLGFDVDAWEREGSQRRILFTADRLPRSGQLAEAVAAHQTAFAVPTERRPRDVVALSRSHGAFDITSSPQLRSLPEVARRRSPTLILWAAILALAVWVIWTLGGSPPVAVAVAGVGVLVLAIRWLGRRSTHARALPRDLSHGPARYERPPVGVWSHRLVVVLFAAILLGVLVRLFATLDPKQNWPGVVIAIGDIAALWYLIRSAIVPRAVELWQDHLGADMLFGGHVQVHWADVHEIVLLSGRAPEHTRGIRLIGRFGRVLTLDDRLPQFDELTATVLHRLPHASVRRR